MTSSESDGSAQGVTSDTSAMFNVLLRGKLPGVAMNACQIDSMLRPELKQHEPQFPADFRDLYGIVSSIHSNHTSGRKEKRQLPLVGMLDAWLEPSRLTLETYEDLKRRTSIENNYKIGSGWLRNLYALSRVNDRLLCILVEPDGKELLTKAEYTAFFEWIGFSSFETSQFTPFHHEIVEVVAETSGPPVQVVDAFWPGLTFGEMMFSRSGVAVLAHPDVLDKKTAEQSVLYDIYARHNRRTNDLSMGWGHNSQWANDFERSYETSTHYYFGCPDSALEMNLADLYDGYIYGEDEWVRKHRRSAIEELSLERCREVRMHRCFVKKSVFLREQDQSHFRQTGFLLCVRKAPLIWPLEESLIEPYFDRITHPLHQSNESSSD
jgi:hypothetical protein